MRLSILVPVYNEIHTVSPIVSQIDSLSIEKEIILVDDFSTDGTRELLKDRFGGGKDNIRVFYHHKNLGKGTAIKTALEQATGDYAIIQDADLEYNPEDYNLLLEVAERKNQDVVYGSRFLKTWRVTSLWHFLVNKFLTVMTNILYSANLTDMETCYKLIKTEVFKGLDIESQRFEIEAEITARLLKKGYKIIEVPISYKGRSYHEGKKITWKDGFTTLWTLFKYRFQKGKRINSHK